MNCVATQESCFAVVVDVVLVVVLIVVVIFVVVFVLVIIVCPNLNVMFS